MYAFTLFIKTSAGVKMTNSLIQNSIYKEEFLSVVSHGIRTHLAGIIGFSELLYSDSALNRNQRENIRYLMESSLRLNDFLTNIQELSRLTTEKNREPQMSEIDIAELVENITSQYTQPMQSKNIRLELKTDECKIIYSDRKKLQIILMNLISNAVKFTENGKITIEIKQMDNAFIFHVIDSGIGIEPDKQAEIFDTFSLMKVQPFYLFQKNMGFGLTVSKILVELLGGTISVESMKGEGSCFTVSLPRKAQ